MDVVTQQNQPPPGEQAGQQVDGEKADKATRRRGAALEAAILDAGWVLLTEVGYNGFTFDAIADRAQTSKPVLYRRWPTRGDLLRATIRRRGETAVVQIPDTGSLRKDVIELLRSRNIERLGLAAVMSVQLGTYFAESGTSPADLRRELLGGRASAMRMLVDRAAARGECRPDVPDRIATLPFDLFRAEVMMTLRPMPDEEIVDIVDTVFLPLVKNC
jgi:AcrR family transcriptional regulator